MINLFKRARKFYIKTFYEKGSRNIFSERPAPHTIKMYENGFGPNSHHIEDAMNSFHFSYHNDSKEALRMVEYVLNLYGKDFEILNDKINIV